MAAGHRFVQWLVRCAGPAGNYDWVDLLPAKPPDTALHSRIIAPRSVGTTILRMTRKTAGSGFASTLALAAA